MLGVLSAMLCCGAVSAQQHEVEMIPFGNDIIYFTLCLI